MCTKGWRRGGSHPLPHRSTERRSRCTGARHSGNSVETGAEHRFSGNGKSAEVARRGLLSSASIRSWLRLQLLERRTFSLRDGLSARSYRSTASRKNASTSLAEADRADGPHAAATSAGYHAPSARASPPLAGRRGEVRE